MDEWSWLEIVLWILSWSSLFAACYFCWAAVKESNKWNRKD